MNPIKRGKKNKKYIFNLGKYFMPESFFYLKTWMKILASTFILVPNKWLAFSFIFILVVKSFIDVYSTVYFILKTRVWYCIHFMKLVIAVSFRDADY